MWDVIVLIPIIAFLFTLSSAFLALYGFNNWQWNVLGNRSEIQRSEMIVIVTCMPLTKMLSVCIYIQ